MSTIQTENDLVKSRLDEKIKYFQDRVDKGWVGLKGILDLLMEIKNGKQ